MFSGALFIVFCAGAPSFVEAAVEKESPAPSASEYYEVRSSWKTSATGMENVSVFIFRDADRTGHYDSTDHAVGGVVVELDKPDGETIARLSNMYGFANFTTALEQNFADIDQEGIYRFRVIPPPGWIVIGDYGEQDIEFQEQPESRVGLVALETPAEVGLAQSLSITGASPSENKNQGLGGDSHGTLIAMSSSGTLRLLSLNDDGSYSVPVYPGLWVIQVFRGGQKEPEMRYVHVDRKPVKLANIDAPARERNDSVSEFRRTLNFDDFSSGKVRKMPNGWCGLTWKNLIVTEFDAYLGVGYRNNLIAGEHVGYNSSGYPVTVNSELEFDFHGAYFGGAWPEAEGETLILSGWRGEELVGYGEFPLSAYGPFWLQADFRNITKLKIKTKHYWQFVMDFPEFSFHRNMSTSHCPED